MTPLDSLASNGVDTQMLQEYSGLMRSEIPLRVAAVVFASTVAIHDMAPLRSPNLAHPVRTEKLQGAFPGNFRKRNEFTGQTDPTSGK